jgi:hypothetical protein
MELLVWVFVVYSLLMCAWVSDYLEEWDIKYLLVFILAPHSAIVICSLWSFGIMIKKYIYKSAMVEKIVGFMNKRLF